MKRYLLPALAGLMLSGLGFAAVPASAAVSGPTPGVAAPTTIEHVRMTRHHRMTRHRMMRRHRMRRMRMGSDINASNPSRPGYQQNKGSTTRGYR